MSREIEIYNLEFPQYINTLKIVEYIFNRTADYESAFSQMMHLGSSSREFKMNAQTGSHQITAKIHLAHNEKPCSLPWSDKKATQLEDVLLLLTLFTDRNVFKKESDPIIIGDHRIHQYGGQLACSIEYESRWKHIKTGELKTETEMGAIPTFDYKRVNVGFEIALNKVLALVSSQKWQEEYERGYFLFLFKSAIQRQVIETAFISCWTIWEHIFAIKNRKWLDDKTIEQMSGDNKIAFVLNEYFSKYITKDPRKNIQMFSKTRNRLVHFGKKTDQIDFKEMEMFIRLTEQLIAIILDLPPSNIFNSLENLDSFLKKNENKSKK